MRGVMFTSSGGMQVLTCIPGVYLVFLWVIVFPTVHLMRVTSTRPDTDLISGASRCRSVGGQRPPVHARCRVATWYARLTARWPVGPSGSD